MIQKPVILFFILLLLAAASPVAAQTVPLPDPDWGENQHVDDAIKYWSMWEKSGPDTNIAEARAEGYKQLMSMRRPKGMLTQSSTSWVQVGGCLDGKVSGRPTAMAFSKQTQGVCYLATSGGGLWKSYAYGSASGGKASWTLISGSWSTNAAGGVAVDYTDDNIIYAGTGDLYSGDDQELSNGEGIYKSTDGGLNWTNIASTSDVGGAVNQVIIDPKTNTTIYATSNDGVHKSIDAGASWKKILALGSTTTMVIDQNDPTRLYVGGAGVIKRSLDGGDTWSLDLAKNISGKNTVTMALSTSNTSIIYASIGGGGTSVGLAVSKDSGATWTLVSNPQDPHGTNTGYMSNQAFYDNACAVGTSSPNNVIVGGLDVLASTNGGQSFPYITNWQSASGSSNYTHADIHVLQYGGGYLWALTDGGVFLSGDNGKTWSSRNAGLPTLLFVGGDADAGFTFSIGGAQDNGVSKTANIPGDNFAEKVGGDGGRCYVSQTDGLTCYSTYVNVSLQRSPNGGESWDIGPNGDNNVIPANSALRNEGVPFYMYYHVCESDPTAVAIAGNPNVYYSSDGVQTLTALTKGSTAIGGTPQTVYIPDASTTTVYVGAGSSTAVTTSADAGGSATWTKSTQKIGMVSDWASDPNDPTHLWVSIAGSGGNHFAVSTDAGTTWQFPATNLPNLNILSIARAPNGDLFLGHTLGVLRSIDNGVTWEVLNDGLPLCQVNKLRVRGNSTKYLLAATYGLGMFSLNISDLPRSINPINGVVDNSTPNAFAITSVAPNPAIRGNSLAVTYQAVTSGPLLAKLYDELGREVKTLANETASVGNGTFHCSLPEESGSYWIVVSEGGRTATKQVVVQ